MIVLAVPEPTWRVIEPASVSAAFCTGSMYPLELVARFFTTTECVPATATAEAELSVSTFVSELEPVFCVRMPVKSVS